MQSEKTDSRLYLDHTLDILYSVCQKHNTTRLSVSAIVQGATNYIRHNPEKFGEPNLRVIPQQVVQNLLEAEKRREVTLTKEGNTILKVHFDGFYVRRIFQRLQELRREPEIPMPTASSLAIEVPDNLLTIVDAQEQLVTFLERSRDDENDEDHDVRIIKLKFTIDLESILIPYTYHTKDLTLICLQKVRFYLRNERNQSYMRQKMMSLFRHREKLVEQTFTAILTRPDTIIDGIWEPNEFSYYFWMQISNSIIKEYSEKKEKLVHEQNYIQAAVLIGMIIGYRKSSLQKEGDKRNAFKFLETQLRQDPYIFSINKMFEFKDRNSVPLIKKLSHQDIIGFIDNEMVPPPNLKIPLLIMLNTGNNQKEYIRKDLLFTAFFQRSKKLREKINSRFVSEWGNALHIGVKPFEAQNQDAFEDAIHNKVKSIDPHFAAMLDFSLLYFTSRETPLTEQVKAELRKILDEKKLEIKPLADFFDLERSRIYSDAKLLLPVWKTIPGIAQLARFFQKMFIGVDRQEEAERTTLKERNRALQSKFAPQSTSQRVSSKPNNAGKKMHTANLPSAASPKAEKIKSKRPHSHKRHDKSGKHQSNEATPAVSQREKIKITAQEIKERYSSGFSSPEEARNKSLEKWNTIIDSKNRRNLTIDVENLAKDQARKILQKRGSGAPTMERIIQLSNNLAEKDVFDQIRDKKSLQDFIILTIAKYLDQ